VVNSSGVAARIPWMSVTLSRADVVSETDGVAALGVAEVIDDLVAGNFAALREREVFAAVQVFTEVGLVARLVHDGERSDRLVVSASSGTARCSIAGATS